MNLASLIPISLIIVMNLIHYEKNYFFALIFRMLEGVIEEMTAITTQQKLILVSVLQPEGNTGKLQH
jgi:hypothetical protein